MFGMPKRIAVYFSVGYPTGHPKKARMLKIAPGDFFEPVDEVILSK